MQRWRRKNQTRNEKWKSKCEIMKDKNEQVKGETMTI